MRGLKIHEPPSLPLGFSSTFQNKPHLESFSTLNIRVLGAKQRSTNK